MKSTQWKLGRWLSRKTAPAINRLLYYEIETWKLLRSSLCSVCFVVVVNLHRFCLFQSLKELGILHVNGCRTV